MEDPSYKGMQLRIITEAEEQIPDRSCYIPQLN
jgi:hypothetical protein